MCLGISTMAPLIPSIDRLVEPLNLFIFLDKSILGSLCLLVRIAAHTDGEGYARHHIKNRFALILADLKSAAVFQVTLLRINILRALRGTTF